MKCSSWLLLLLAILSACAHPPISPVGAHLGVSADWDAIRHEAFEDAANGLRARLRGLPFEMSVDYRGIEILVTDKSRIDETRGVVDSFNNSPSEGMQRFTILRSSPGRFSIDLSEIARIRKSKEMQNKDFEIVRRGLDEMGVRDAIVTRFGDSEVRARLPGYTDLAALQKKFGPPPRLIIMLVAEVGDQDLRAGRHPPGTNLYVRHRSETDPDPTPVATNFDVIVSANEMNDVQCKTDQKGLPMISICFDNTGRDALAKATKESVGHRMALVLDEMVVAISDIHEPLLNGEMTIEGFAWEEARVLASEIDAATKIPPYIIIDVHRDAL